jgi:branched-chain amino acid transport system substrate-binding protein
MKMKKAFGILTVVLILATALAACGTTKYTCEDRWGCVTIEQGQTIKIAYVGPMTGDYSAFGIDISRGVELAVKDHPDIEGFQVEVLIEDTQGTPEQGAAVANKLAAEDRLVGVAGHTFSGSTEAAIPVYEDAHIVMVSPSTTLVDLPLKGPNVYNRVAFSDGDQGRMAANYVYNTLGVRKIVGVHDGGAYGQGLVNVMTGSFKQMGGEVLGIQAITPGETDYSAQLADIATLSPELLYFGGYDADAAVLVTQMAAAGLGEAKFFGCDGTYGANYLDLSGTAAEGTYSTYVPIPPSAAFDKFKADYEATYGDPQGKLSPFSPHGYDSASVLIEAIKSVAVKSGSSLIIPRQALAQAVRSIQGFTGLTGTLTNDGNGNLAAAEPLFMVVQNGDWTEAAGQ